MINLSIFFYNIRQVVHLSASVDSLSVSGEFLDHSSQPRRKKESHRSQYTHQYKHPEEYPVNDHGHVLPVLLYLTERRHSSEGHFKFHTTPPLFLPAVSFHPWLISLEWLIFPLWGGYLLNVSQSLLVCLMKNSRSNYRGPIVSKNAFSGKR